MSLLVLMGVALALFGGAYFLTRGPAPKGLEPEAPPPEDATRLRDTVAQALRARLAGWELELLDDKPLQIAAVETGSEKRLTLDLSGIAPGWYGLEKAGRHEEAASLVESFVRAATGEGAGSDQTLDAESAGTALALALVAEGRAPKRALTRPAGPLEALLVMRHPNGYDVLDPDDLTALGLTADEAFAKAFANLKSDVEEGLPIDIVSGDDRNPKVIQIAPNDPVAASYALVPMLAAKMFERLASKDVRFHLVSDRHLFVAPAEVDLGSAIDIEGDRLEPEPVPPGDIAWR